MRRIGPYGTAARAIGGLGLFYLAAWRGQPGCEITVISNAILQRDDQVGCPVFYPIDAAESSAIAAYE